jgi:hypothetical protein
LGVNTHVPATHPSEVQGFVSLQTTGRPLQIPLVHASLVEQALPSLHGVPLALLGFEHPPVVGLHVPAT